MRYLEGEEPNPLYPHSEGMHVMLSFSMLMSLVIGIVLLYLGYRGRIMWLKYWSGGLIVASIAYLVADFTGFF